MSVAQAFRPAGSGDILVPSSKQKPGAGKLREPADKNVRPTKTATLADLYDPLAKAHAELDRTVDLCYRPEKFDSDRQRVEFLFALYEKLTAPLLPVTKSKRTRLKAS
jgi:hypothetical protein